MVADENCVWDRHVQSSDIAGTDSDSEQGSALKSRDYKDATDLILRGGVRSYGG